MNMATDNAEMLTLIDLNDDMLVKVLGQFCDLPSVAAAAATCRRFAGLIRSSQSPIWRAHLIRVLSVAEDVELAQDARTLLQHAVKEPNTPKTLNMPSAGYIWETSPQLGLSFKRWLYDDRAVRATVPFSLSCPSFLSGISDIRTVVRAREDAQTVIQLSKVCYFEVKLLGQNDGTQDRNARDDTPPYVVSIGLSTVTFPLVDKQVGWTHTSFGYHSDDGNVFHGDGGMGSAEVFGPTFETGDIVGCSLHLPTGAVFYTLNGNLIGTAALMEEYEEALYATVGFDGSGSLEVNFGQHAPFRFDPDRAAALYEAVPPFRHPTDPPTQLPDGFACVYPQASLCHPWSPRGRVRRICLDAVESDDDDHFSSDFSDDDLDLSLAGDEDLDGEDDFEDAD